MRNKPRLIHLLAKAHRAVQNAAERISKPALGVTPVQLGLLYCLQGDEPVPMAKVGRLLDLSPAGLTGLVDRMVQAGLIERCPSPADGRAVNLIATARGAELRSASFPTLNHFNEQLFEGVSQTDQRIIVGFLENLVARLATEHDTSSGENHDRSRRRQA